MRHNPFSNRIQEDLAKAEKEVKQQLSEIREVVNTLLIDQRYRKFTELLKKAEENTIDLLLRYKESDPYKFKAKVDEFLVELNVYRAIIRSVNDLSKDRIPEQVNIVQSFKNKMQDFIDRLS